MDGMEHNYCEALGKPVEEKYLLEYFRSEKGERAIQKFRGASDFNEAAARVIYMIRV
jgi:hypothetical protein